MRTIRLAALFSHPIQYFVPAFRELATREEIDLTVYYCSQQGIVEATDTGFGTDFAWDVPLLEGYEHRFLDNHSPFSRGSVFFDNINPGVVSVLRRADFDVIYVNGYTSLTNWFAFIGSELFNVPILFRGASTLDNPPAPVFRQFKRTVLRTLFSRIEAFAAVGTRNREYFRGFGVPPEAIVLVPNSVDNEFFQHAGSKLPPKQQLQAELGIGPGPVTLFVGKLVRHKRPESLLRAFDRATDTNEGSLVFVGDGEKRSDLERTVAQLGRSDNVHFTGFVNQSELPKYYKAADVFVLPSSRETWGLVINEAMNFSLPVVATDAVGAVPDLVDEDNGRVVATDDVDALAEVLKTLLDSEQLRERLGEESSRRIESWGIEETADGIVDGARLTLNRAE